MSGNYRNSRSHKLQITWIPINFDRPGVGHIGVTFCPGKVQPWSMTGGWDRDIDLDIRELRKSNVKHVISLITKEEMNELKVKNLGKKLQHNGIEWYHAPTPDEEVPDHKWFVRSLSIIKQIMPNFSRDGTRVVVHCKGGISRAGMFACIVAWLMSKRLDMDEAISMFREMRDPRGINKSQEQYLLDYESNWQTWVQNSIVADQWLEEMA